MLSHLFGNPDDETYPLLNRMNELFGNPNHETNPKATLPKLKEALQVLEKKEEIFTERVAESVQEEAIVYALVGNKKDAIHKLRIKRFFESHIDLSINCRIVIDQQINAIYDGKATTKTVDALRAKVVEMKAMQKAM
ncbi:Vacuolar protein sorting-associated protein 32 homolog 1 [Linum perenne]